MSQSILIVIPARYASTRLPGKPLVKIAGVEMIKRVADIADSICRHNDNCTMWLPRMTPVFSISATAHPSPA